MYGRSGVLYIFKCLKENCWLEHFVPLYLTHKSQLETTRYFLLHTLVQNSYDGDSIDAKPQTGLVIFVVLFEVFDLFVFILFLGKCTPFLTDT